jgi:hypothetical protein
VWFPLAAGDTCDIEFSESSWRDYLTSGQESPQQDVGRHKLSFALVHPVVCPTSPVTDSAITANNAMVIGQAGGSDQIQFDGTHVIAGAGATDFVALAQKVDQALSDLATWVKTGMQAFAPSGPPAPLTFATPYSPDSVAASVLKAK